MTTRNLWQKERKQLFRELTIQYQNEGYDSKTSKRLAKEELEEIMTDQYDFISNIQKDIDEYN
tara:strand:+ start:442 stop:630 length:189 start_codon:yes stop_codon:yes gene_type:complete